MPDYVSSETQLTVTPKGRVRKGTLIATKETAAGPQNFN